MKTKPTHGGARPGAGRKPKDERDKVKTYAVYLKPSVKDQAVKKHGSLTKAITDNL